MNSRPGIGVIALVLTSLLWGTTGTTATFLPHGVSPFAIGASTMGIGGALLFLNAGRRATEVLRDPEALRWIGVGSIGVVVYPLAFYAGMQLAGVAVGNVVALGSGPIFAALIEWLVERRRLSGRWAIATGISVAGIIALAIGRRADSGAGSGDALTGIGLSLVAGLAYAVYTYASSRAIQAGHGSRGVMGAMFGIGALPLLALLAVIGGPLLQSWRSVALASYLAIGPMFIAYLLFGIGLRSIRSSSATTITLLEPLVATALAVVVVGERLVPIGWVGAGLVLAGLLVLVTARRGLKPAERL